ncbi:MAG: protein-glutamate O-methyltransferase CheR [Anaerolineae bacterium]|nr:protein-glutamate O-methyltransferase CheR [Anaerolineae bacterium]
MMNTPMELAAISRMVQAHQGYDISMYAPVFLESALRRRMQALGMDSSTQYCTCLETDPAESAAFHQSLNIQYSAFFRDPLTFGALERMVVPALVQTARSAGRKEVRVWSAGCAAGQEAYSIAMLLEEQSEQGGDPFGYRIFATDHDSAGLENARRGVFPRGSADNVPMKWHRRYFTEQGGMCTVSADLRARVDFSCHDLLAPTSASPTGSIFGDFDLVLCCNVLIYYNEPAQRAIMAKLHRAMAPGAYLVCDDSERALVQQYRPGLQLLDISPAIFRTIERER